MNRSIFFLALLLLFGRSDLLAQPQVRLSGTITSKQTGEALSRASIAILGTPRGTIANTEGKYTLTLDAGTPVRLRITSLGYDPDTIALTIAADTKRDITLIPSPSQLDEIVVTSDASRVEARRVMHEAIKRKKLWRENLLRYSCSAYSRWNIRTISGGDTTVRSVVESNADGFWKKDNGLFERVTSKRQTANFPSEANDFSLGEIVNFYDDRVDFNEFSLVTPIADDAFSSYDYDLISTATLNGSAVWKIKVEPGIVSSAFDGTLWIDQVDYSIAYLDLAPSAAVKLGPMKDIRLQQTFNLFQDTFWMPVDLRSAVTFKLEIPFVPAFKFEMLSLIKDYKINSPIADSFFTGSRHRAMPGADSVDTAQWNLSRAIPLADDESKAYTRIDSVVSATKGDSSRGGFDLFSLLSFVQIPRYDQIEGWRFGLSKGIKPFDSFPLNIEGSLAYGLNDKAWKYDIGIRQGLLWTIGKRASFNGSLSGEFQGVYSDDQVVSLWLAANYFNDLAERGEAYSSVENTITSLIYKKDYQEFYWHRGFRIGLELAPRFSSGSSTSLSLSTSATMTYTHSEIWNAGSEYLVNDSGVNAKHQYGAVELSGKTEGTILGSINVAATVSLLSSSRFLGSDYSFTTVSVDFSSSKRLGGWGVLALTDRFASRLAGSLPRWDLLYFETRNRFFSKFGYLRGLSPFEYMGDKINSLILEHNFYDLPTRLLGLHFMDPLNLQWRFHAGLAVADLSRDTSTAVHTTGINPYYEIGFGIGNIYNIINLEATWRLTHKTGSDFYPTLALQFSF